MDLNDFFLHSAPKLVRSGMDTDQLSKLLADTAFRKDVPNGSVEISKVTDERITFSDGSYITYWHEQDCCEENYADFRQLEEAARDYKYQLPMMFEPVDGYGFRFGDSRRMFFVPCYSDQNGYYSSDVEIIYTLSTGDTTSINVEAEWRGG